MNRLLALLLFITLFPIIFIVGLIVLTVERENCLFIQARVGKNKNKFNLIKLRTMQDGKITFIGSILRKTGIDEIPQLINIIKGDMNFIGPRPLTEQDILRLGWNTPHYNIRWDNKPGLTGLAQLNPICNKKLNFFYDKYYIQNKSIKLDLKIIVLSSLVLFLGKNRVKTLIFNKISNKK